MTGMRFSCASIYTSVDFVRWVPDADLRVRIRKRYNVVGKVVDLPPAVANL